MTARTRKECIYICPKCGATQIYCPLQLKFSKEDGCCHECVDEEPDPVE